MVVTDLCVMEPDPVTRELTVVSIHPGIVREQITEATGWPIKFADNVVETQVPSASGLETLGALQADIDAAHGATLGKPEGAE